MKRWAFTITWYIEGTDEVHYFYTNVVADTIKDALAIAMEPNPVMPEGAIITNVAGGVWM